jgi:DNA repair protein RecN (Recombination protein N)
MLHEILIQNYAVIDNLKVEFAPGLNLLSGETGSGKSILVDALGLVLGGRASVEVIRTGQERTLVTAVFRSEGGAPWRGWLEEYGLAQDDEGEVILRREIQASGKSRMLVNDQPVTLAAVKSLAGLLVEMHGQNEHVALFARDAQLDLLDQFAGVETDLERVRALASERRQLQSELESLSYNEQERLRTIDLLSFQAQELERARVEPGEDTRLEEERLILANLERIRAAAAIAYSELYDEEGAACSRLAAAMRQLEELRRYDAALEARLEPLQGARAVLEDTADYLRHYLGKLEANPQRLEEIQERLALLDRLKRKYGRTLAEIIAYGERTRQELAKLEHADERSAVLRRQLEKVAADYGKAAEALSAKRREAAHHFARLVREELAHLGMEKTRLEIHFERLPEERAGARGIDEIEFRISPNPGEELRTMEKIASGGEISRLMLALKTVVGVHRPGAGRRAARTFVFDEIDSGVGGRVAECVGQRLKRLARDGQVLCVTHLAQIACFADQHYYVEKFERAGRTLTSVTPLAAEKERVRELARMLSGSQITEAVMKHATAMLRGAGGVEKLRS